MLKSRLADKSAQKTRKKAKKKGRFKWIGWVLWCLLLLLFIGAAFGNDTQGVLGWFPPFVTYAWLTIPIIIGIVLVFCRKYLKALLNVVGAGALGLAFGLIQVPHPQVVLPQEQDNTIRVMTYNIRNSAYGIDQVVTTIVEQDPDVLLLQECNSWSIDELKPKLKQYHFVGTAGRVVAAKNKLAQGEDLLLLPGSKWHNAGTAIVDVHGQKIRFVSVHLPSYFVGTAAKNGLGPLTVYGADVAQQQIPILSELADLKRMFPDDGDSTGLVIAGDFNCPPIGQRYKILREHYTDAFDFAGSGLNATFPSQFPVLALDRQWCSAHITPVKAWVVSSTASDHRPLVVDYRINKI